MILNLASRIVSQFNFWVDRTRIKRLCDRGLKIGKNVYIMDNVEFDDNYPHLIEIEDGCRISRAVRILSHDATLFREMGITRLAKVRLLQGTFIGERAIILPGVTLGPRAMVAAGSVVNRDFPEGAMIAGNPARLYGNFDDYKQQALEQIPQAKIIALSDTESGECRPEQVREMVEAFEDVFIAGFPGHDPAYLNADLESLREMANRVLSETLAHSRRRE